MKEHENGARIYAINEESAVVECTWPKDGRPDIPMPYSDEIFNGSEYQFAAHLMFNGFVQEALNVVKAIRDRYNGKNRNPWDEFECGHNYIRSMAAFGMLIACSGFTFNMNENSIGFAPKIYETQQTKVFKTFWSVNEAWGAYEQNEKGFRLKILWGTLKLKNITIKDQANAKFRIKTTDMNELALTSDGNGMISFKEIIEIHEKQELIGIIQ
jgi:non-lysosomal glucosylceramidase